MTSIVLADDHDFTRHGLQTVLETQSDFHVIGEARDGLEAMEVVERYQPDVLVVDVVMPGLTGLEVTRRTAQVSPKTCVVVLSMYDSHAYVAEALRAGAKAYVLKRSESRELVTAIRDIIAGQLYLSPPLSESSIKGYIEKAERASPDTYEMLTAREREVLQLTAEGRSRAEIANLLYISTRTVEAHRASLMQKLGLHSQTEVIRYALRRGLLQIDG